MNTDYALNGSFGSLAEMLLWYFELEDLLREFLENDGCMLFRPLDEYKFKSFWYKKHTSQKFEDERFENAKADFAHRIAEFNILQMELRSYAFAKTIHS